MDAFFGQRVQNAALAAHHAFHGMIIGQHAEHHLAMAGIGDALRYAPPLPRQSLRLGTCAVVDSDLMADLEKVASHRRAHIAEADETDIHDVSPSQRMMGEA